MKITRGGAGGGGASLAESLVSEHNDITVIDAQLDGLTALGTGVMLWANIPIMLIFGPIAMRRYHEYMRRLKAGEMKGHAYPTVTDVVEGKDVE